MSLEILPARTSRQLSTLQEQPTRNPFREVVHRQRPQQKHARDLFQARVPLLPLMRDARLGRADGCLTDSCGAYVEEMQLTLSRPSIEQHLAALKTLFDWLVIGQIIGSNPAQNVRGPKYSQ